MKASKFEKRIQNFVEPYRGIGSVAIALGGAGFFGGLAYASQRSKDALEQMRDGAPNGDIQGNANAELQRLLLEGKTHYGDMPGTTLSGQEIAGAEEMYEGVDMMQFGLPTLIFGIGFATGSTRVLTGSYIIANAAWGAYSGKSFETSLGEFVLGSMIPM